MNLARRILEGIHEVELDITPEFQQGPDKKLELQILEAALRTMGWKEGHGIGGSGPDFTRVWVHPKLAGIAIRVTYLWQKNELIGDSFAAVTGNITKTHPATPEMVEGLTDEWLSAAGVDVSDDHDDRDDEGFDRGLNPDWYDEEQDVLTLSAGNRFEMNKRVWMHIVHSDEPVTEVNPVWVLVNNVPAHFGSIEAAMGAVYSTFEGLEFQTFWADKISGWKVWPDDGQTKKDFNKQVNALISRIDELIYSEDQ